MKPKEQIYTILMHIIKNYIFYLGMRFYTGHLSFQVSRSNNKNDNKI